MPSAVVPINSLHNAYNANQKQSIHDQTVKLQSRISNEQHNQQPKNNIQYTDICESTHFLMRNNGCTKRYAKKTYYKSKNRSMKNPFRCIQPIYRYIHVGIQEPEPYGLT